MLRRAITAHHHHRLCTAYTQCLSHTTATILSRRPFSNSLVIRLRQDDSEASSRLADHAPSSSSPPGTPSEPSVRSDPQSREEAHGHDVAIQDHASRAQAGTSNSRKHTRTLRPLLIPPSFPPDLLLPTTSTPASDPPPPQGEEKQTTEPHTDAATIQLADLPPNTLKTDLRPVFQPYGEVKRIIVQPDGRSAAVVFADAAAVSRALHAYAEEPLRVRGQEIVVFRKRPAHGGPGVRTGALRGTPRAGHEKRDDGEGNGAIFVSNFPAGTTQEEVLEALARLGKSEGIVMRPGSKYAFVRYSSDGRVEDVLRAHARLPITVRGNTLRIERTDNRTYISWNGSSDHTLDPGKPLDPAEASAIVEELKETVPRWRGSYEPSRVLWIGRLPYKVNPDALTNFWSRLGCVVEVRSTTYGFAHVEFASTEEAIRAARQGAPHGFRYADRLLDVDFAPWIFYVGPAYRVVYISGWPPSHGRSGLLHWAGDIPNVIGTTVLAPFRGQTRADPRGAFLQFRTVDDTRTALRALDGRKGPGGETLRVTLSRAPAVHPNRLWRWACMQEGTEEEAVYFEDECDGLGFATVEEDQGTRVGDHGDSDVGDDARGGWRRNRERDGSPPVGMRGGRFRYWMNARRERERNRDALRSHPLWTIREADRGLGEDDENEFFDGQDEEQERGRGEGERRSVPLSKFLRPTRRHQLTNMVRDSVENGRG